MSAASTPKCSKDHAAQVTDGGYSCDVCKKGGHKGNHWKCRQCNYDFCTTCAPLTAPAAPAPVAVPASAVAPTPPAAPSLPIVPPAPAVPTASAMPLPYKCVASHVMQLTSSGFACDRSGCGGRGQGEHFKCRQCDYDYCLKCAPITAEANVADSPKPAVAPPPPSVAVVPPVASITSPPKLKPAFPSAVKEATPVEAPKKKWATVEVSKVVREIKITKLRNAYVMPLQKNTCNRGHEMELKLRNHNCDICRRGPFSNMHYVCMACNYDACTICISINEDVSASVKPVVAEVPKCKSSHPCLIVIASGTCSDCPRLVQAPHWSCAACSFHFCTQCKPPPSEAIGSANAIAKLEEEKSHDGPNASCDSLASLAMQYMATTRLLKRAPLGCFDVELTQKIFNDEADALKRYKNGVVEEIERLYKELNPKHQRDDYYIEHCGTDAELKLRGIAPGCAELNRIRLWRKETIETAKKLREEAPIKERAALTAQWITPFAVGGMVKVGEDEWEFKVQEPYATFKHTKRLEWSFLWLPYHLPGGNLSMRCVQEGSSGQSFFGYMQFLEWEGAYSLTYVVQAANLQDEWLSLSYDISSNSLVTRKASAESSSWKINADNGVTALTPSRNVPIDTATVIGKVPWQLAFFAAACVPLFDKIGVWAEEAGRIAQKRLDKERKAMGW